MPKLCKPTIKAILFRMEAVRRHAKIYGYQFALPLNETAFGLNNKIHKFSGNLTKEDIIDAINEQNSNIP